MSPGSSHVTHVTHHTSVNVLRKQQVEKELGQQYVLYSYLFFIKTKLKVLLKIVLIRSAVDRLKMKRLVTVRIFRGSGQRRSE